ncbi:hypothetical protein TNCV_2356501 [Trichonephila clavipes]|nr:hypothetical protein TNCV_2356501 [Trichonephila clavipes]
MILKKKKNALVNLGRTSFLTPRRMQCLPPNAISTVAEETSKFAMKKTNFQMAKNETKQREKREFPNSVMKDINPLRQSKKKICSSSPNSIVN